MPMIRRKLTEIKLLENAPLKNRIFSLSRFPLEKSSEVKSDYFQKFYKRTKFQVRRPHSKTATLRNLIVSKNTSSQVF